MEKLIDAVYPTRRMRRLRGSSALRTLIAETRLSAKDFILPLFVREEGGERPITSMPGHMQHSLASLQAEIAEVVSLGIPGVILFGIPKEKNASGSSACRADGILQQAVASIKERAPELLVIVDCCLCDYTDHGHCGPLDHKQRLDNDATLDLLRQLSVSYARSGADVIAPSGMIDGAVGAIRSALDEEGFLEMPILSYAAKYASSLYRPFREAALCAPQFGDRKTYQMHPGNSAEALREVSLDLAEGADLIMVKPALTYLDVIYRVKQAYPSVPLAAYHTSGEFAQIKAAALQGWADEQELALETLTAIKRAGANCILTYYAKEAARWLI